MGNPLSSMRIPILTILPLAFLLGASWLPASANEGQVHAGAYVQDITPTFEPILINGGFTERRRGKMNPGELKARCFVLKRDETLLAIAVVDSCMIPRTVCDRAKVLASEATGIPKDRILISATHTHSAPSTMDYCLGTMADLRYTKFLPPRIAEGIREAHARLEPAEIGWRQLSAPGFTHNRRWITRPDKMLTDPFGNQSVRAMMHPGYQNPAYIGPSGPVDDELSVLSIRTLKGKPLGILANFSMHYFGGGPADYFGMFSDRLSQKLSDGDQKPVCAMSQGTSGDLHWMNYGQPKKGRNPSEYADGLVKITEQALEGIEYEASPSLEMRERTLTLVRRLPDEDRLQWADEILEEMGQRRPRNRTEVYAEQARFIHENPTEKLVLQAVRIGDLAITAIPNEVYAITGLKLKAQSPFSHTFNIELANGAAGYIPPPEQFALGGYTTWPARTAGLEVTAEPKIVDAILGLMESLSGEKRLDPKAQHGEYPQAILGKEPLAFWRCEEFGGGELSDSSGSGRVGKVEGPVAYYLPGPDEPSFSGGAPNRALQLAGGTVSASVPRASSVAFWFWNGMESGIRENTGDLVNWGSDLRLRIGGSSDGNLRGRLILQNGDESLGGKTALSLRGWHHLVLSREGNSVTVFLDGRHKPEIETQVTGSPSHQWRFGGSLPFEGRIDEVAWFESVLGGEEAEGLYLTANLSAPAAPPGLRQKVERGDMSLYAEAVLKSNPVSFWRLRESARDSGPKENHGQFEKGAVPAKDSPQQDTFRGGRMRANVKGIGDTYSVEFWVRNSLPDRSRPVTGYLFSRGVDGLKSADGDQLGIGGTHASAGRLIVYQGNTSQKLLSGRTELKPESWHHVVMVREGDRVRVYLNGNPEPEIDETLSRSYPEGHPLFFFGGRNDNFSNLQGRLDEVALYDRALKPEEISSHYRAVTLSPVVDSDAEKNPEGLSPEESLGTIRVPKGYAVQLVAAEPLVRDPVAIDWGADGKLWVAEMADYPSGIDGKPGGRVRYLEDTNGDGTYDKSTLFLESLNYPSGVMSYRKGVLVTAAPDIFYAEDTDGDGKADLREVLFTGFKQGNQQLRVNGLRWGIDNWIYGANGSHHARYAAGISIASPGVKHAVALGSLDFRMKPGQKLLEPVSGPSQFGRARDDWGNWFGVQNSFPLWHYVLESRYLTRNPDWAAPDPRHQLMGRNPEVVSAKAPQKRFHSFSQSGRFTSACSPMIYRDSFLFEEPNAFAFTCEPFHNLVQRMNLSRDGSSFSASRAEGEGELDFFASKDRWCRPVMVRTGPDGALWVVDMYRYMIEHPDWLPAPGKEEMRPHERRGEESGRIYRVVREGEEPRPMRKLAQLSDADLVNQLSSRNGVVRDIAHRLLIERESTASSEQLIEMVRSHEFAQARLHALHLLEGLGSLDSELVRLALGDAHPEIRRHALVLSESFRDRAPDLLLDLIRLAEDPDASVRLQAALSLGETDRAEAGVALAKIMVRDVNDPYIRSAVFSSAAPHFDRLAEAALKNGVLVEEVLAIGGDRNMKELLSQMTAPGEAGYSSAQLRALSGWLDRNPEITPGIAGTIEKARAIVGSDSSEEDLRVSAVGLLGRQPKKAEMDRESLAGLLKPQVSGPLKLASIDALVRIGGEELPSLLLEGWPNFLPKERVRILDRLLQRNEWTEACLAAVESGRVARGDLDASRRQLLLTHTDPEIRKTAERVFQAGERQKQIEAFRGALKLEADETRGRAVFGKLCATCHLPAEGVPMNGPDLRSITDRSAEGLFHSILDPNASVDPTYAGYSATLTDGVVLFGRVLSETSNHITLRLLDGSDRSLRREEIESLQNSGRSLMPDGLEAGMTQQDLADLIRFLQLFKQGG